MNLPLEWETFLESAGWFARHWSSLGDPRAPDREIMELARRENYLVITQDLDFGTLLALTQALGPSIIPLRVQNTYPHRIGTQVLEILRLLAVELQNGALVTLDADRFRVRVLPLPPRVAPSPLR